MVKHWKNNNATKWGYLWNFFENDNKITNKTDYEAFIREHYNFTIGKPNYESCISENRFKQLKQLKQEYLQNLDLN
jgi:predicted double-glycine peptidase